MSRNVRPRRCHRVGAGASLVGLALLTAAVPVAAAPVSRSRVVVAVGLGLVGDLSSDLGGGVILDSEVSLVESSWLVAHGRLLRGSSMHGEADRDRTYMELRGGLRLLGCTTKRGLCGLAGVDVGSKHFGSGTGLMTAANLGLDGGDHRVRFKLEGGLRRYRDSAAATGLGLEVSLLVGYRL